MVEDKDANAFAAEFHRLLRSAQMNRFVRSQPGHQVQQRLPERFHDLLHKLDRAQKQRTDTALQPGRRKA